MELTDWRGNTYREGSNVIYAAMSGRSVELQEATVLEIKTVYRDPDQYKWVKLEEHQPIPRQRRWDHDKQEYVYNGEEVKTEVRVKLQPTRKGSRNFSMREDSKVTYIDPEGKEYSYKEMDAVLSAEHGPSLEWGTEKNGWKNIRHWWPKDFGWQRKEKYVLPKPVTLTVIDNITVI